MGGRYELFKRMLQIYKGAPRQSHLNCLNDLPLIRALLTTTIIALSFNSYHEEVTVMTYMYKVIPYTKFKVTKFIT